MTSRIAYEFGDFRFEPFNGRVLRGTTVIPLTAKAADTLSALVQQPDVLLSKEELIQAVWPDATVEENNLSQQISTLRRLLSPEGESFIETMPRRGYRFVGDVRAVAVPAKRLAPASVPSAYGPRASGMSPAFDVPPEALGAEASASPRSGSTAEPAAGFDSRLQKARRPLILAAVLVLAATPLASQWQRVRSDIRTSNELRELGDGLMRKGDPRAAVTKYQRAIQHNPKNAMAYGALAHALHKQSHHDSVPRKAGRSPSVEAAERAVLLDPTCGSCHGTLGFFLYYHEWQWTRAEAHLREAIRLEPNRESIRPSYALLLAATGRLDEAHGQIDFALARQPYHLGWRVMRASFFYLQRRYPEALAASDDALALDDKERSAWEWRSKALFQLGRGDEAIRSLAHGAFADHGPLLERAVTEGGGSRALRALANVTDTWPKRVEQSWRRAAWQSLLNDRDAAFDELERAFEYRNFNLIYIATDPVYDVLRTDPRFDRLVARIGLDTVVHSDIDEIARRTDR